MSILHYLFEIVFPQNVNFTLSFWYILLPYLLKFQRMSKVQKISKIGPTRSILADLRSILADLGAILAHLGPILVRLCESLGRLCESLGRLWEALGRPRQDRLNRPSKARPGVPGGSVDQFGDHLEVKLWYFGVGIALPRGIRLQCRLVRHFSVEKQRFFMWFHDKLSFTWQ